MKLIAKSSVIKKLCIVGLVLISMPGLTTVSATNSTGDVSAETMMSSPVATVKAHFHPSTTTPLVTGIDSQNRQRRRAKRDSKRSAKKGNGGYSKFTKKFKCTKETTPLEYGGSKVTKKCVHQFYLGNNDIQTANGSGRTSVPSTWNPSAMPSSMPSGYPTSVPTSAPTGGPTSGPTTSPSTGPTTSPTAGPTTGPTTGPTSGPTQMQVLVSSLPNEARGGGDGSKTSSSSKTAVGALVGGVLGFVVLAGGAKAVEKAWRRKATSDDASNGVEEGEQQA